MNHGSLFSGIGGFDLAAEWMGWNNVFHCEWNEFGKKILKYYWPNSISYDDITKSDFTIHRGNISILSGGFPCQPYSAAGKRKGKEDARHLWPEMLRAIREIQPTWVVGENVFGITNWNGGLVFNEVQTDLEAEGYEVQPFVLPACAVNAPHRRDRVWFIAYSASNGHERRVGDRQRGDNRESSTPGIGREFFNKTGAVCEDATYARLQRQAISEKQAAGIEQCCESITTNTKSGRKGRLRNESEQTRAFEGYELFGSKHRISAWDKQAWDNFPTEPPICSGDDGLSTRLDFTAVWGGINPRKPFITFAKWRNESIKAYGNAIVPQVALQIFKSIAEYENLYNENPYNQK